MVLVVLVVLMALASPAAADEGSWTERWLTQSTLTGNWFGARDTLAAWGITPSIRYSTDLLANVAGGERRGKAYAGQLAIEIGADMETLAGLRGLAFDVSGDWASGTDLSVDIGNVFTAASVSAPRGRWVIRSPSLLLATWMTLRRRQRSRAAGPGGGAACRRGWSRWWRVARP